MVQWLRTPGFNPQYLKLKKEGEKEGEGRMEKKKWNKILGDL